MNPCPVCSTPYDMNAKRFCPSCGNATPAQNTDPQLTAPAAAIPVSTNTPPNDTVLTLRFRNDPAHYLTEGQELTIAKPGNGAQMEVAMPGVSSKPMKIEVIGVEMVNGKPVTKFKVTDGGSSEGMWATVFIPSGGDITAYAGTFFQVGPGADDSINTE